MDNRKIGVFDSGLGGLTAVKELMKVLPEESIVYFGDTGRVPYGTKSNETIIKYTASDINFLMTFDLKLIIVACGTASAIALPVLRDRYEIPVIGVAEATARAAVAATENNRIGIIGTQGTIQSDAYNQLIRSQSEQIETISKACPLFVPLVENGYTHNKVARLVAKEYLAPVRAAGVDTLIMGCTHYPLLADTIGSVMGSGVTLIDPGKETAHFVRDYLIGQDMLAQSGGDEQYQFFASDSVESFTQLGSAFLEQTIEGKVERVDIENYT